MRKNVLTFVLIFLIIIFFIVIISGINFEKFRIYSYGEIEKTDFETKSLLKELNYTNDTEYNAKKEALQYAVKEYGDSKNQYYKLVEEGKIIDNKEKQLIGLYDVDFLLTTIGNYSTEKGVTLQLDINRNLTSSSKLSEYVICDLNFTVTGDYSNITNFLYSIENDSKLSFEINNFLIEKGGENLQATFVVKGVPVNRKDLSSVTTIISEQDSDLSKAEN